MSGLLDIGGLILSFMQGKDQKKMQEKAMKAQKQAEKRLEDQRLKNEKRQKDEESYERNLEQERGKLEHSQQNMNTNQETIQNGVVLPTLDNEDFKKHLRRFGSGTRGR